MKRIYPLSAALLASAMFSLGAAKPRSWLDWANGDPKSASRGNPYEHQADAVKAGEKLYERYCSACHGGDAKGLGRNPSLHSPTVKNASPGALYWLLRNGSLKRGMPSWSYLPPEQRWQLVTWMKSLEFSERNKNEASSRFSPSFAQRMSPLLGLRTAD